MSRTDARRGKGSDEEKAQGSKRGMTLEGSEIGIRGWRTFFLLLFFFFCWDVPSLVHSVSDSKPSGSVCYGERRSRNVRTDDRFQDSSWRKGFCLMQRRQGTSAAKNRELTASDGRRLSATVEKVAVHSFGKLEPGPVFPRDRGVEGRSLKLGAVAFPVGMGRG